MIAAFRAAVIAHLDATISKAVHQDIPDDVAELPCVVVGLATVGEGANASILDLQATVYAVGRRQSAGSRDQELDELADEVLAAFGDSRAVVVDGTTYHILGAAGRTVDIAGLSYPAYTLTVEASVVTC